MKSLISKLFLLFVLFDNLQLPLDVGFDFRVTYIFYALYIIYYIVFYRRIKVNLVKIVLIFGLLLLFFIVVLINKEASLILYIRQVIYFSVSFLACYLFVSSYKFNVIRIFKDYIDVIYFSAIIGLIQFLSFKIGFRYGADYSYLGFDMGYLYANPEKFRVQSWFSEPSFLVYAYIPVVFVAIGRFFKLTHVISIKKSIIILLVLFLSKSSIGYLALIISILIIGMSIFDFAKKPIFLIPVIIFTSIISVLIYQMPMVKFRVDDTVSLFFNSNAGEKDINKTNLSTYALYSNYKITLAVVKDNPVFGFGWGNYEKVYDKYLPQELPFSKFYKTEMNRKDASGLILRISAELGILSLALFLLFLLRYRIKIKEIDTKNTLQINYWLINNGIFVLIFLRCIRQGNYFMLGFTLFLIIYFFSKKQVLINN